MNAQAWRQRPPSRREKSALLTGSRLTPVGSARNTSRARSCVRGRRAAGQIERRRAVAALRQTFDAARVTRAQQNVDERRPGGRFQVKAGGQGASGAAGDEERHPLVSCEGWSRPSAMDEHIVVFAGSAAFAFEPSPVRDHRDDVTRAVIARSRSAIETPNCASADTMSCPRPRLSISSDRLGPRRSATTLAATRLSS